MTVENEQPGVAGAGRLVLEQVGRGVHGVVELPLDDLVGATCIGSPGRPCRVAGLTARHSTLPAPWPRVKARAAPVLLVITVGGTARPLASAAASWTGSSVECEGALVDGPGEGGEYTTFSRSASEFVNPKAVFTLPADGDSTPTRSL